MPGRARQGAPVSVAGVVTAWGDLRGSMRRVLAAELREGSLLALAMASGVLWYLGRMGALWLAPETAAWGEAALIGRAQGEFVSSVLFRTLALYGVAGLAGLAARAVGGTGSWRESRAATFWAALVAAPVLIAATLLAALVAPVSEGAAAVLGSLGGLAFAGAFSAFIAEAHGFRSTVAVFAIVAAPTVLFLVFAFVFG